MPEPVKRRRPYRSDSRRAGAEETRRRIVGAARERFAARGWSGTSIAAVAADAGVAAETVYAAFGTKAALLEAVVRGAARGEDAREILEQEGPARVAAAGDPREMLGLFAEDVSARLERVAPLMAVLAAAAASEPALAAVRGRLHGARRAGLRVLIDQLAATGALRLGAEEAVDAAWALASPELYALLTGPGGWDRPRYAAWLAATLAALLLGGPGA